MTENEVIDVTVSKTLEAQYDEWPTKLEVIGHYSESGQLLCRESIHDLVCRWAPQAVPEDVELFVVLNGVILDVVFPASQY